MANLKPTILIIEDEAPLRKLLQVALGSEGYRVIEADAAQAGLRHAAYDRPDLILLDLGLPDLDGIEAIKQIRAWSQVPVIIVSARGREQDKVAGLDAGADDYITKPFSTGELAARVRVALRHAAVNAGGKDTPIFANGELRVDLARREVTLAGKPVHLTPNEFRLLSSLVRHAGMVKTHKQLLTEVWGESSAQESHYLRVYMNQLRSKIEADPASPKYLRTESGVGYRLTTE